MQVIFREIHDSKLLVAFGILPLLITIALYSYDRFHVKPIPEKINLAIYPLVCQHIFFHHIRHLYTQLAGLFAGSEVQSRNK